jgi:integrating conjugative element protein (TIGR03761 family)
MTTESQQRKGPQKKALRIKPRNPRPGALRGVTTIILETVPGADLYYGLNENKGSDGRIRRIIGLRRFNEILTRIWENAPTDPWALWYLVRIEAAIDKSQAQVENMLKTYRIQLNNWKITYEKSSSRDPVKIEVKFAAPLGYRAANLVVTADDAIRLILHAHHVGMIEDSLAQEDLHTVGRSVRGAFETAIRYQEKNAPVRSRKCA